MQGRMASHTAFTIDHTTVSGAVCGIIAAVVMAMVATMLAAVQGEALHTPVMLIGATFLGQDALAQPTASAVLGVITHMAVGALLGYLFAAVTRKVSSTALLVAAGLAYGAGIFLVMTYVVLPFLNPLMAAATEPGWFFVYHLAFGLVLPLTLAVARTYPSRQWFGDRTSGWIR